MKKQTRARILREKLASFSALVDASNTLKSIIGKVHSNPEEVEVVLQNLCNSMEERICEHLPSTVEEADIQKTFLNNIMMNLSYSEKELTHSEGMNFLTSFNQIVKFYSQSYNHLSRKSN